MENKKITNLQEPSEDNDAVNKKFLDKIPGVSLTRSIIAAGGLDVEGKRVDGLPNPPPSLTSATSKEYVDGKVTVMKGYVDSKDTAMKTYVDQGDRAYAERTSSHSLPQELHFSLPAAMLALNQFNFVGIPYKNMANDTSSRNFNGFAPGITIKLYNEAGSLVKYGYFFPLTTAGLVDESKPFTVKANFRYLIHFGSSVSLINTDDQGYNMANIFTTTPSKASVHQKDKIGLLIAAAITKANRTLQDHNLQLNVKRLAGGTVIEWDTTGYDAKRRKLINLKTVAVEKGDFSRADGEAIPFKWIKQNVPHYASNVGGFDGLGLDFFNANPTAYGLPSSKGERKLSNNQLVNGATLALYDTALQKRELPIRLPRYKYLEHGMMRFPFIKVYLLRTGLQQDTSRNNDKLMVTNITGIFGGNWLDVQTKWVKASIWNETRHGFDWWVCFPHLVGLKSVTVYGAKGHHQADWELQTSKNNATITSGISMQNSTRVKLAGPVTKSTTSNNFTLTLAKAHAVHEVFITRTHLHSNGRVSSDTTTPCSYINFVTEEITLTSANYTT